MTAIRLQGVSRTYQSVRNDRAVPVLRDVDLVVAPGEKVAMLGRSGSGKSTLLSILGLLDAPTAGTYYLDGAAVRFHDRRAVASLRAELFGYIFQQFCLIPQMSALENVEAALIHGRVGRRGRRRAVLTALDQVGLADRSGHRVDHLSGGEKQRVAIARAVVARPRILLADEPTGSLDEATGAQVMDRMRELVAELGATFVCITHDSQIASEFDRVVRLRQGRLVEDAMA